MAAGRPQKPAHYQDPTKDRNYNSKQIEKMKKEEQALRGSSSEVMVVPGHLSELGKQYYANIVREMEQSEVLGNLDIPLISLTAETLAIIRDCEERINDDGLFYTVTDRNGDIIQKPHPAVSVRDKNLTQVKALLTQMGMTPSSRASLAADNVKQEKDNQDPLLKVLKKQNKD